MTSIYECREYLSRVFLVFTWMHGCIIQAVDNTWTLLKINGIEVFDVVESKMIQLTNIGG